MKINKKLFFCIFVIFGFSLSSCSKDALTDSEIENSNFVKAELPLYIPDAIVTSNFSDEEVDLDSKIELKAEKGEFKSVKISKDDGGDFLSGEMTKNKWNLTDRLDNNSEYNVKAIAIDDQGLETVYTKKLKTKNLPLDKLIYPSIYPLDDSKVGVGMPVIIRFDVPVDDRENFEKYIKVKNSSNQEGAFNWLSDREVHWRPKDYWKPDTEVNVTVDIKSIPAGNGKYGQVSKSSSFEIGDEVIVKVDTDEHQLRVYKNGEKIRTLPTSTGEEPKYTTRSGIKVIMEKHRFFNMNSASVGISPDSPEGYNLQNVEYAMRLTNSGEFIHAAPWNSAYMGTSNRSHGCTGLRTADAGWLYGILDIGDPIEYEGSDEKMTLENGYGDWNLSWEEWTSN